MSAQPDKKRYFSEFHEIDRTIRPASDSTLRGGIRSISLTAEMMPAPGPQLDRLHELALEEVAENKVFRNRQPYPRILENLALIQEKRGDAEAAARTRAELAALIA